MHPCVLVVFVDLLLPQEFTRFSAYRIASKAPRKNNLSNLVLQETGPLTIFVA